MAELSDNIMYIKGVGPRRANLFNKLGIYTVEDLLLYYTPRRYVDRSQLKPILYLDEGETVTVYGAVQSFGMRQTSRGEVFNLVITDESAFLTCSFFNAKYIANQFEVGDDVLVSGKVSIYRNQKQMMHPEFEVISGKTESLHAGRIVPIYPLTAGLYQKDVRKIMKYANDQYLRLIEESIPSYILNELNLLSLKNAVANIHYPETMELQQQAHHRLAFEELFYLELMLALRKQEFTLSKVESEAINFSEGGALSRKLVDALPFALTKAQKRVIREIVGDMRSDKAMNRLLQGDVGSGKTIVAVLVMLIAIENGYQAAMMAPTEILADQHYRKVSMLVQKYELGVHVVRLMGGLRKREREVVYAEIADGTAQIIMGTHALIQEAVEFHNLGFVVIDEQHRFGVMQRSSLRQKARKNPDVLVMTATPIPRTLALTVYGNLDVSIIDEIPPGRQEIKTSWTSNKDRRKIYEFVRDQLIVGRQAYFVYPLVEESEKLDAKAATEMAESLRKQPIFKDFNIGLLHGRMKPAEKDEIMQAFLTEEFHILVSTTVIEVGVDIPNASVMVIENAERFGLTQLHQLRGRVGRGQYQSYCILIASYPVSDTARERLDIMQATTDGFKIAEADLKIRGPGEFFGTKQSGLPELKSADLTNDTTILFKARDIAFKVVDADPELNHSSNMIIRQVLDEKYRKRFELAGAL